MEMVGHQHERVQARERKMLGHGLPTRDHQFTARVQLHGIVGDVAKQTFAVVGAQGEEIGSELGVIVPLHTDRMAMMVRWVVWHATILWSQPISG